jgi:glycogen synthase
MENFKYPQVWREIMKAGMQQDFSWGASAAKYEESYQKALAFMEKMC